MSRKEEFQFLSKDGVTKVHALKWIPEDGQYKAVLQITHGMVEFIERYEPFAEYMNQQGYLVVGHDHIGHGQSVASEDDWGYMAENGSDVLVEDMHQLRTLIQKENAELPYFMFGHSMGSYMLRKYLTIHGENLRGAIICGTGSVPDNTTKLGINVCKVLAKIFGWRHRSKMVANLSFGGPYKKYDLTGKTLNNSWLTKDEEIVKSYYSDPRCTFIFTLNGYRTLFETVLYDNQMEHIDKMPKKLPIFIISGEDDPVGDCGVGVKKVYDDFTKAKISDLTWKLYPNDRHEILNETDHDKIFHDIYSWLEVRLTT